MIPTRQQVSSGPSSFMGYATEKKYAKGSRAYGSRHLVKAPGLDYPRPWVWTIVFLSLPVWIALELFSRVNHGSQHLVALGTVFVGFAGSSIGLLALWREYGRAARMRGAREAHSQFLAAAETSLDAFALFESVRNAAGEIIDFRILYVNANAERLAGRPRTELLGQMLCSVTPLRPAGRMFAKFCKVVHSGEPLNEEFPVDHEGIKATWLRSQVVKLGDGLAVTFSDISEAKATQQRYANLAEFTDSVFQSAPFSIIATDTHGLITAMNVAAEKLTGYSRDELVGKFADDRAA